MTNQDFRDLFCALNAAEVRYLVVGGYAVAVHAKPRFTKDLDVWIDSEPMNAQSAWRALAAFGAPMQDLRPEDLTQAHTVFQIGVPPNRIDVLTSIAGIEFSQAWPRRMRSRYADCDVSYLSREDLIRNKRAVGRPQDLIDADLLERLGP